MAGHVIEVPTLLFFSICIGLFAHKGHLTVKLLVNKFEEN